MSEFAFPAPRTAPLRGGAALRWGVIAPGWISRAWSRTVLANTDQRILAVASRSLERAEAFARDLGIERAYGSAEALVADPGIDAVYVGSLNELHREHALLAIAAGKHVLVEKPLACTAEEAREIAAAAAAAGVLAMEAMWTRFLPQTDVLMQLCEAGELGELGLVSATFSGRFDRQRNARVFATTLGGGALLDIGIYPVSFGRFFLGSAPTSIAVSGTVARPEGIDARSVVVQAYANGARAIATTALDLAPAATADVLGTRGRALLTEPFFTATGFELLIDDDIARYRDPNGLERHEGLCYQAAAFAQHVADGRTEAPERPLAESVAVLEIIDEARRRIGAIAPPAPAEHA